MGGYVASPGGVMALPLLLVLLQAAQAPATIGSVPSWTLHFNGDIRWQQITPAGALLVSSDGGLAGVDVERGQIAWQKPELGGLPVDSVRMVEGSLLMEAAKPGLSMIFDPVTGTVTGSKIIESPGFAASMSSEPSTMRTLSTGRPPSSGFCQAIWPFSMSTPTSAPSVE